MTTIEKIKFETQSRLVMQAFRRKLSAGAATDKLLKVLLQETMAALNVSSGSIYLSEGDQLESYGKGPSRKPGKRTFRKMLKTFEREKQSYIINEARQIATPLYLSGQEEGVLWVADRQFDDGIDDFEDYDRALLLAFAATASLTLEKRRIEQEKLRLRAKFGDSTLSRPIIGNSQALKELRQKIALVASHTIKIKVLIVGESGTGKELVARAIQEQGTRKDKPFVIVNCAAIQPNLLESELFGHKKGAFTGADNSTPGKIEIVNGGTLFLDEIGELSMDLQAKLLRVLQEGTFHRVGDTTERKSDFQLISATNKDLVAAVADKTFREDLYYRINHFPIEVPPLRERIEDIPLLVNFFLNKLNQSEKSKQVDTISADALKVLSRFDWPGNIRQLEYAIDRAYIACPGKRIRAEHLPEAITSATAGAAFTLNDIKPLDNAMSDYVNYVYHRLNKKTTKAMDKLDIDYRRFQRYLYYGEIVEKQYVLPLKKDIELEALALMDPLMAEAELNEQQQNALRRSVIEAIINAVEHGGKSKGEIIVDFSISPKQFRVSITDNGRGFDSSKVTSLDFKKKFQAGETRGWGLHIIRKAMDKVKIKSSKSGTRVTMTLLREQGA